MRSEIVIDLYRREFHYCRHDVGFSGFTGRQGTQYVASICGGMYNVTRWADTRRAAVRSVVAAALRARRSLAG